jgi:hypothetical protein
MDGFRMNSYSQANFLIFCVADCVAGFSAFLGAELAKVVAWRRLRSLLTLGELPNRYIGSTVSNQIVGAPRPRFPAKGG